MALFIAFEGGELSGKSTQSRLLYNRMIAEGKRVIWVHEPGSTRLGEYLREYLIGENRMSHKPELLLFAAARSEIVETVIRPNLQEGINVIADRYMHSTVAYQGYGRGMDLGVIDYLNEFVAGDCVPDLTMLMDLPEKSVIERGQVQTRLALGEEAASGQRRLDDAYKRKFERMPREFHAKVRRGYLELAASHGDGWFVVDGREPLEVNAARIWERVQPLLA